MEEKGIKELLELVAGLEVVGVAGRKILKDKKLGFDDFAHVGELLGKQQVLMDAVDGASEIKSEAKDLNLEEAQQVISRLIEAAKNIKAAGQDPAPAPAA